MWSWSLGEEDFLLQLWAVSIQVGHHIYKICIRVSFLNPEVFWFVFEFCSNLTMSYNYANGWLLVKMLGKKVNFTCICFRKNVHEAHDILNGCNTHLNHVVPFSLVQWSFFSF